MSSLKSPLLDSNNTYQKMDEQLLSRTERSDVPAPAQPSAGHRGSVYNITFQDFPSDQEYEWAIMFKMNKTGDSQDVVQERMDVRRKLRAAGLKVVVTQSRDEDECYFLVTTTEERFEKEAERIGLKKFLTNDAGLAPFILEHKALYVRTRGEPFFASGERQQLVFSIINADITDGGAGLDLFTMKREGQIFHYFPLHNNGELEWLTNEWGNFKILAQPQWRKWFHQPLDRVRSYFGEQVALYFGWLGFYTWWLLSPAIIGTFIQLVSFDENAEGPLTILYSIFLALWAVIFLEFWNRQENEYKFRWDTTLFEETEELRPEFIDFVKAHGGKVSKNPITGHVEVAFNAIFRLVRIVIATSIILFMMMIVIFVNLGWLYMRLQFQLKGQDDEVDITKAECDAEPTKYSWDDVNTVCREDGTAEFSSGQSQGAQFSTIIFIFLTMSFFSWVYGKVAPFLNEWENHPTDTVFTDALIIKVFSFEFVNNYFALMYLAYMKTGTLFGEETTCEGDSCMDNLGTQLAVVFFFKTAVSQVVEVSSPFVERWWAAKQEELEMRQSMASQGGDIPAEVLSVKSLSPVEVQAKMPQFEGTFDDYSEMAIQFGYVTLFAPAFPVAPLLALANNLTEIRGDAIKLCKGYQRPVYTPAEDIGFWYDILQVVSICAVLTNSFLIAFVSKELCKNDRSAPWEEIDGIYSENTTYCDDITRRYDEGYLWAYALIIEHIVLVVRTLIQWLIPDEPSWVSTARDEQTAKQQKMLKTAAEKTKEASLKHEYDAKLQALASQKWDEGL